MIGEKICINLGPDSYWTVHKGSMTSGSLTWGEMIEQIIYMTSPEIKAARYQMKKGREQK